MNRDALVNPQFGDVFCATYSPRTRPQRLLFLARKEAGWWDGLDLTEAEPTPKTYTPLSDRYPGWRVVERATVNVEMTCDHAHRGARTTMENADDVWRGCTYRRVL